MNRFVQSAINRKLEPMKFNHTFSILAIIALMSVGCSQKNTDIQSKTDEMTTEENDSQESFKLKKNMVSINSLVGNYTVKVGQQLVYSASVHGSVGYTAKAQSSNEEALPLSDSFIKYKNKRKSRMPGGDAATKYFVFDALKVGTYEVFTQKYFRGDLESESTITITVTE